MSGSEGQATTPQVEIIIVPASKMPDSLDVVPVEVPGHVYWLFRDGHISASARDEFNSIVRHMVANGLWGQCWPDGH